MFNYDCVSLVHHEAELYTVTTFPSLCNFVFPGISNCLVFPFALFSRYL